MNLSILNSRYRQITRQIPLLTLLFLVGLCTGTETFASPTPFHAVYKAKIRGFILPLGGKGTRQLVQLENGQFLIRSEAKNALVSVVEQSRFVLETNRIRPLEYQYHRKGIGKNRNAILTFDWEKNKVLNNVQDIPWKMDITAGTLDKLVYQLQLREDLRAAHSLGTYPPELHYSIADGGKLKDYYFKIVGEEVIDSPLGKINTLKVERIKYRKNRSTVFWLAPEYEFLLIKLVQVEKKGRRLELLINKLDFDDPNPESRAQALK